MSLKKTETVLSIFASLIAIIGAVIGVYYYLNSSRENPTGPPQAAGGSAAHRGTVPPAQTTGSSGSSTTPGTNTVETPPKPVMHTVPFSEDFKGVKDGLLPTGWDGDEAIGARKDGERGSLEVVAGGPRKVTLPELSIAGDFFLEFEAVVMSAGKLELLLLGRDGPDFPLTYTASGGYNGYGASLAPITMSGVDPKVSRTVSDPLFRIRLERERDIYRLLVNGEVLYARRLSQFKGFKGAQFTLPGVGPPATKLYSIRVGPLDGTAPVVRKGSKDVPPVSLATGLNEDFRKVVEGDLPAGWDADNAVAVRKGKDAPAGLEVAVAGPQVIKPPVVNIDGDFFMECEFQLISGGKLELTLPGAGGPDFTVVATGSGGYNVYGASLVATMPGVEPKTKTNGSDPRFRLRLEREGEVYRLLVNGETLHTRRMKEYKGFTGVRITLPGGEPPVTRFYALKIGALVGGTQ